MQNVSRFPVAIDTTDDQITLTYSNGEVEELGRLSGYPGSEMTSINIDDFGTLSWTDPLGVKTEVGPLFKIVNYSYASNVSGILKGYGEPTESLEYMIRINSLVPESGDLMRSLTDDDPENALVLYNGWLGVELVGVGTILASSYASTTYRVHHVARHRYDSVSTEDFVFASADTVKELVWEFNDIHKFSGVEFSNVAAGQLSTVPESFDVYTSNDGANWELLTNVKDYELAQYIEFDSPVITRHFKVKALKGRKSPATRIPGINFIVKKSDALVPLDIETEWYDKTTTNMVETDSSFELSPIFDNTPNLDTFLPLDINPSLHMSTVIPKGTTNLSDLNDRMLKFDNIVSNSLDVQYRKGGFKLPMGRYKVETDVYLGDGNPDVVVQAIHGKTGQLLAQSQYTRSAARERHEPMGTFYLEFEIFTEDFIYFNVNLSNAQFKEELYNDVYEYIKLTKVPPHALERSYLPFFKYVDHLSTIDSSELMLSNLEPQLFDRTSGYYYFSKGNPDVGNMYSEIILPTPKELVAYTLVTYFNNTVRVGPYEIQALVDGKWTTAIKVDYYNDLTKGLVHSFEFDTPLTSNRWRVVWIENGDASTRGNFYLMRLALHTSEKRFNPMVNFEVLNSKYQYASESVDLLRYSKSYSSSDIELRIDEICDIRLDPDATSSLDGEYTFTLHNLLTGESLEETVTVTPDSTYVKVFSNVQPGVYRIQQPTKFTSAFYLERV